MRRTRTSRWLAAAAAAAAAAAVTLIAAGGTARAATVNGTPLRDCRTVHIPVALAPGQLAVWQAAAEYCTPHGRHVPAVDELAAGATYNDSYWDPAIGRPGYSFVDRTLAAGRATLAIDRLGTGSSSRPPASELTAFTAAYVLHQVTSWARHAQGHSTVDLIGHSVGSIEATIEAAAWPGDVSRLILTGYLTAPGPRFAIALGAVPAYRLARYITTYPGTRAGIFYDRKTADPAMTEWDEQHKDVISDREFMTALSLLVPSPASPTAGITAPVDIVDGQQDLIFCGGIANCSDPASILTLTRPFFPHAASLSYTGIPDTGHVLALSTTAGESFAAINRWLRSH